MNSHYIHVLPITNMGFHLLGTRGDNSAPFVQVQDMMSTPVKELVRDLLWLRCRLLAEDDEVRHIGTGLDVDGYNHYYFVVTTTVPNGWARPIDNYVLPVKQMEAMLFEPHTMLLFHMVNFMTGGVALVGAF